MHILLTGLMALAAAPAAPTYPAQAFPAQGVRQIVIGGVRGHVRVRGRSGAPTYQLRVAHAHARNDDWGLVVERRGDRLVLEVFSTALGHEWKPILARDRWPRFDLELDGPAVPVVVGWRDGAVTLSEWPAAVDVNLLDGVFDARAVGPVTLRLGRGEARLKGVAGAVDVRGEDGRLALEDVRGPARLDWFSGAVRLTGVHGDLSVTSHAAALEARGGSGRWALDVPRERTRLVGFVGELRRPARTY